jgi:hypothetical protein
MGITLQADLRKIGPEANAAVQPLFIHKGVVTLGEG